MPADVLADSVMSSGTHLSLGRPCSRWRCTYTDLPVPVGPTSSRGWPDCRHRSRRKVYLGAGQQEVKGGP
jgi:hypothetical protein